MIDKYTRVLYAELFFFCFSERMHVTDFSNAISYTSRVTWYIDRRADSHWLHKRLINS